MLVQAQADLEGIGESHEYMTQPRHVPPLCQSLSHHSHQWPYEAPYDTDGEGKSQSLFLNGTVQFVSMLTIPQSHSGWSMKDRGREASQHGGF